MVDAPNQGATGAAPAPAAGRVDAPASESPLSVETEGGPFAEPPRGASWAALS